MADKPQHRLCTIPETGDFDAFNEDTQAAPQPLSPHALDALVRGELNRVSRSIASLEVLLQQHNDQHLGESAFASWAPASPREGFSSPRSADWAPGTPREDEASAGWALGTPREEKSIDGVDRYSLTRSGPDGSELESVETRLKAEINLLSQAHHVLQDLVGVHHARFDAELGRLGAEVLDQKSRVKAPPALVESACKTTSLACEGRHEELQRALTALEARLRNEMEAKHDQSRAEQIDRFRDFVGTSSSVSTPASRTRSERTFADPMSLNFQEDCDTAPSSASRDNPRIADLRGKIAKLRRGGSGFVAAVANERPPAEFEAQLGGLNAAVAELRGSFIQLGGSCAEGLERMEARISERFEDESRRLEAVFNSNLSEHLRRGRTFTGEFRNNTARTLASPTHCNFSTASR